MPNGNSYMTGLDGWKQARAYLEQARQREIMQLEKTIALAKTSSIPWPAELVGSIVAIRNDDFDEVMTHHLGHKLNDAHDSIKFFLRLFNEAYKALENAVQHYHVSYGDLNFFSHQRRHEHDQAIFDLNRCIFNFATSGDALRNSCIKQASHYKPEDYDEHIRNHFAENNLHHFMQNLRVALHHEHFVKSSPTIAMRHNDSHATKLYLDCKKLLRLATINRKAEAKAYVEGSGVRIDVHEVFRRYSIIVNSFYGWLLGEMDKSANFADYQRCLLERKKFWKRANFSILLNQWVGKDINPYDHLDQYLDNDEIEQVNKLPHRSCQQVDKIIEFADKEGACNDSIRNSIYELFKVSSAEDPSLTPS
jgi:hypothetical protein